MRDALAGAGWALALVLGFAAVHFRRGERAATDRLLAAWKDGAVIPPPDTPAKEPDQPPDVYDGLPSVIMDWLSRWEEEPVRQVWARRARTLMTKHRANVVKVLDELDAPNF